MAEKITGYPPHIIIIPILFTKSNGEYPVTNSNSGLPPYDIYYPKLTN